MYTFLLDLLKLFLACMVTGGIVALVYQLGKNYFGKKTTRRS